MGSLIEGRSFYVAWLAVARRPVVQRASQPVPVAREYPRVAWDGARCVAVWGATGGRARRPKLWSQPVGLPTVFRGATRGMEGA
eukprot:10208003-Lingulodinium_polyedra.AAC.1